MWLPRPIHRVEPEPSFTLHPFIVPEVQINVRVSIDRSGRVIRAESLSRGNALMEHLSKIAVQAARQWTFSPARREGKNVPSEIMLQFQFVNKSLRRAILPSDPLIPIAQAAARSLGVFAVSGPDENQLRGHNARKSVTKTRGRISVKTFFPGFPAEGLKFLRRLKRNNNREWFLEHKEIYEQKVKIPMTGLVLALGGEIEPVRPRVECRSETSDLSDLSGYSIQPRQDAVQDPHRRRIRAPGNSRSTLEAVFTFTSRLTRF